MLDKFNKPPRSWSLQLANVQNWMPSRRPKYRDTRTGVVYRLDKVDPQGSLADQGLWEQAKLPYCRF